MITKCAFDCVWCNGWYCQHAQMKKVNMYCVQNRNCVHYIKNIEEGVVGRHKKWQRQETSEPDRRVVRVMIKGEPYEIEYGDYMTVKNIASKREAPLDTMPEADLELMQEALRAGHDELDECESVIDSILMSAYDKEEDGGWNTKKEGEKNVDDKKTVSAVESTDAC